MLVFYSVMSNVKYMIKAATQSESLFFSWDIGLVTMLR